MDSCAREHEIELSEKHPCFYCGHDIIASSTHCEICKFMICPNCKKCACNLSLLEKNTLEYIHIHYCQHYDRIQNFTKIDKKIWMDNNIVNNMNKALLYCSKKVKK